MYSPELEVEIEKVITEKGDGEGGEGRGGSTGLVREYGGRGMIASDPLRFIIVDFILIL